MSEFKIKLTLDDASLAGGARIAEADSGRPRRITTEEDLYYDAVGGNLGGIVWDPDNAHVWISNYGANKVEKRAIADWSLGTSVSITGPCGICRFTDPSPYLLYVAAYGANKLYEIDSSNGHVNQNPAFTGPALVIRVPGTTGKVWVQPLYSGTLTEYNWPGMTTTGRTLLAGACMAAAVDSGHIYITNGSNYVKKYLESDLSLVYTWTFATGGFVNPLYKTGAQFTIRSLFVDGSARPWLYDQYAGAFDRLKADGSGFDARAVHPAWNWGGGSANVQVSAWHPACALSDNGRYLAFLVSKSDATAYAGIRIRNVQTHSVTYSATIPGAVTVTKITIPGEFGNAYGPVPGPDSTIWNFRRVQFYYSTDGGSTWSSAFHPSTPQSIAVAAGTTFKIRADMTLLDMPALPAPWLGGDAGEGIEIEGENGQYAGLNEGLN